MLEIASHRRLHCVILSPSPQAIRATRLIIAIIASPRKRLYFRVGRFRYINLSIYDFILFYLFVSVHFRSLLSRQRIARTQCEAWLAAPVLPLCCCELASKLLPVVAEQSCVRYLCSPR